MSDTPTEVEMPVDEQSDSNFAESRGATGASERQSKPKEGGEDASLRSMPQSGQQPNEGRQSDNAGNGQFDAQEEGVEEAKEEKAAVSGQSEVEKTEKALQSKLQSVEKFEEELREMKQRIVRLNTHKDDLEDTVDRVESASDDQRVMEHLDSQVASVEVPPDERNDFLERLQSKVEDTEEEIENVQERGGALQRGLAKNKVAVQWLDQHRSNLS